MGVTDAIVRFHHFFDCCIGGWSTDRTYHDLTHQQVERSRTEFLIRTLGPGHKEKVLQDNHYPPQPEINGLLGFHLAFDTVSETGEAVSQQLNMLFIPEQEQAPVLQGDYLRDRGYEEDRPVVARFQFYPERQRLCMTTIYTQVVALDTITLINPRLRLREIVTYQRPALGDPLKDVILVGFGVEQKTT